MNRYLTDNEYTHLDMMETSLKVLIKILIEKGIIDNKELALKCAQFDNKFKYKKEYNPDDDHEKGNFDE